MHTKLFSSWLPCLWCQRFPPVHDSATPVLEYSKQSVLSAASSDNIYVHWWIWISESWFSHQIKENCENCPQSKVHIICSKCAKTCNTDILLLSLSHIWLICSVFCPVLFLCQRWWTSWTNVSKYIFLLLHIHNSYRNTGYCDLNCYNL